MWVERKGGGEQWKLFDEKVKKGREVEHGEHMDTSSQYSYTLLFRRLACVYFFVCACADRVCEVP